jgi:ribose/xylose/arabinose/galactoside ABC-type transport system permease subunit
MEQRNSTETLTHSPLVDDSPRYLNVVRGLFRRVRIRIHGSEIGVIGAVLALGIALSLGSPYFLNTTNLFRVGRQMTYIGLLAIGMAFVIASGQIDISVGRIITLVTFVIATLIANGTNPWLAFAVGILVGGLCGLFNGGLTLIFNVHPMIITLGTLNLFWGLALGLSDARPIPLPAESGFYFLGQGKIYSVPVPFVVLIATAIVGHIILRRSLYGRHVLGVGTNKDAARYAGIRVKQTLLSVMVLQGLLAGLAAGIWVAQFQTYDPNVGGLMEMNTIAAAVIGGADLMGGYASVLGALLGTILIGLMNNGLVLMGVGAYWNNAVTGGVILVAVGVSALIRWRRQ